LVETGERSKGLLIRIDSEKTLEASLSRASRVLLAGGLVAFPTESFYGLGADATNERAIRRLFLVKGRGGDRPVLLLIDSPDRLHRYVEGVSPLAERLMKAFWPGGLTLVFKALPTVSSLLTAGTGKIGIRLSSHPVPTALARAIGVPVTGTSANLSNAPPCLTAREVLNSIGSGVDLILDGGATAGGMGSTVLDVTVDPPRIVREGLVSRTQLSPFIKARPQEDEGCPPKAFAT
jgi:L-threonylcarbamoyladenylate synthase